MKKTKIIKYRFGMLASWVSLARFYYRSKDFFLMSFRDLVSITYLFSSFNKLFTELFSFKVTMYMYEYLPS